MIEMTDERAAEVLRGAIREGCYERNRVDPCGADRWEADCDAAIAHIEARLRSQPPAEAQAQGGGEVAAWFPTNGAGEIVRNYGDGSPVYACKTKEQAEQVKRCHLGATGPVIPLYTAPPRAPVGVETEVQARESVALALDEAGYPAEAGNVRNGIDLDDYRVELSIARIALAQQPAAVEGAAMKEETLERQLEHCDGKDYTCAAYGECECACDADWTPAEVYLLRDQVDALRKDAERIRWLAANMRRVYGWRDVGGYELPDIATVESYREYCDPQHLRAAIDAAMNGAND